MGTGEIAMKTSLGRLSWRNMLPEGPTDLLRTGHKHMTGLKQMDKRRKSRPVPAKLHCNLAVLRWQWRKHWASMGIEAPDAIRFPATSATGAAVPASAPF